jgi:hypothetical protein
VLAGKDAGLTAPVYAAAPVKKLGHIFFHDCLTSQWVRCFWVGGGRRVVVRREEGVFGVVMVCPIAAGMLLWLGATAV